MQEQREQSQNVIENKGSLFLEMTNGPQFARWSLRSQREMACSRAMVQNAASLAGDDMIRGTGGAAGMDQGNAERYKNSGNELKNLLKTKSLLFLEVKNELETNPVFVRFWCVSTRKHRHLPHKPRADTFRTRERIHGTGTPWRAPTGIFSGSQDAGWGPTGLFTASQALDRRQSWADGQNKR